MVTGAGLVATPSPGSIFAYMAVTPKGGYFGVLLGIVDRRRRSPSRVASLLLGFGRLESGHGRGRAPDADVGRAAPARQCRPSRAAAPDRDHGGMSAMPTINGSDVHKVVVACDAGMGSSVMLASQLRRQLQGHAVTVEHTPVNSIPADADVVVVPRGLADRARVSAPGHGRSCRSRCSSATRRSPRSSTAVKNGGDLDG